MTPEGRVKVKVTKVLKSFGDDLYYFMPVQYGYGAATLDYLCAYQRWGQKWDIFPEDSCRPIFFAIETKRPGKKPTPRQAELSARLRLMGTKVFVIDGDEGCKELKSWLSSLR